MYVILRLPGGNVKTNSIHVLQTNVDTMQNARRARIIWILLVLVALVILEDFVSKMLMSVWCQSLVVMELPVEIRMDHTSAYAKEDMKEKTAL